MAIGLKVRKYVNTSKSETTSVTVQTPESKSIFISNLMDAAELADKAEQIHAKINI